MQATADWVFGLSDDALNWHFGPAALERGRVYVDEGRVGSLSIAGPLVMAAVTGHERRTYRTSVVSSGDTFTATCTCPVRRDCKHAAALLLYLRAHQPAARVSRWQQVLTPLLRDHRPTAQGAALALQVNEAAGGRLSLRPLKLSTRGRWIKTDASWEDIQRGGDFVPAHRSVLEALRQSRQQAGYTYGHRVDALPFDDLREDVWALLRQALAAGVPLLSGEGPGRQPLPLIELSAEAAEPVVSIEPSESGAQIVAALRFQDETMSVVRSDLLGRPPHGVVVREPDRLVLAPLTRPLADAELELLAAGSLEIPADELSLFATGYLPQLRHRVTVDVDPHVTLPEPPRPTLRGVVRYLDDVASLWWTWIYESDDGPHELTVSPAVNEPPMRQPAAEAEIAARLPYGPWRQDTFGSVVPVSVRLSGPTLFGFLDDVVPALQSDPDINVDVDAATPAFQRLDEAPQISLAVTDAPEGDWFNLAVDVSVAGHKVPFGPLFAALATGDDHLLLDSGAWFRLDHPELEQLRQLIDEARGLVDADATSLRLRPEHAGLWEELVALGVVAEQSKAWQESVASLLDVDALPDLPTPAGLQAELRPYQATGFSWLSFLWRTRLGGILADEMGLGKTVQALALAQAAHEAGSLTQPMLVVAPTSVLGTWVSEAARFAPELSVAAIESTSNRSGVPVARAAAGAQIVVTSYALLRLDADQYQALDWSVVLLDEAQFVKNRASKAHHAVRRLRARVKIALTGTPLENNLMDLWSLLSITAPGLFPDPKVFTESFRKPIEAGESDILARLHRRIRPLILRRTKRAVAAELPDKQEQVIPVHLSESHRRLYDKHLARERQKVLGLVDELSRNRMTILRSLTMLRQLSLAPSLVDPTYSAQSAKIDLLVEMLTEISAEGHRALVFSQFTGFLALVRERFDAEGIAFEYLDGRTRDRPARIAAFREGTAPAFLISLKAGGFGLTLTEADYVFILDPWWNPAAEAQAIDRTHRIGQTKAVNVYRLVSADTVEEKVVALQERKRHLFDQVVGTASDMAAPLSADDIRGLLEG